MHPLAGVPVRSIEGHLARLINRGYKIAICDQVTPPGKGLVEREVTRIVTPGTVVEPGLLEGKANNYLASMVVGDGSAGLAYADVTTGEFADTEIEIEQAIAELERLAPSELLLPRDQQPPDIELRALTKLDDAFVELKTARRALLDHFGSRRWRLRREDRSWRRVPRARSSIICATLSRRARQSGPVQSYAQQIYAIRPANGAQSGNLSGLGFHRRPPTGSLVSTIDLTVTPMGGRRLRSWLRHPLLDIEELRARQDAVEWFSKATPRGKKFARY